MTSRDHAQGASTKSSRVDKAGAFVSAERERTSSLVQEGLRSGPVAAYCKVARREVDAPVAVRIATLTWIPGAGAGAGAWITLVASMLLVPLVLLGATDLISHTPLPVQSVVLAFFITVTVAVSVVLYLLVLGRNRAGLRHQLAGWSLGDKAYWTALIVIVPTVGFATLTAFGVRHHMFALAGGHARADDLSFAAFNTYLWNLAHAVPFLDIPDTLKWKASLDFREWYGGNLLLLLYKVALIVPLLQLFTLLLRRLLVDDQTSPTSGDANAAATPNLGDTKSAVHALPDTARAELATATVQPLPQAAKPTVATAAMQMLLTIFTTTAGILAGVVSRRASAAQRR